jgi:hypothetical protein
MGGNLRPGGDSHSHHISSNVLFPHAQSQTQCPVTHGWSPVGDAFVGYCAEFPGLVAIESATLATICHIYLLLSVHNLLVLMSSSCHLCLQGLRPGGTGTPNET